MEDTYTNCYTKGIERNNARVDENVDSSSSAKQKPLYSCLAKEVSKIICVKTEKNGK